MISAKPILVTGASGKTGRRVIAELAARGACVRAFIRRPAVADELTRSGAREIAIGDLGDRESLVRALTGAGQVLHICPPLHPREDAIAKVLGQLVEVALVAEGEDEAAQARAARGHDLLLYAAHGQHGAEQVDLARHCHVGAHRPLHGG